LILKQKNFPVSKKLKPFLGGLIEWWLTAVGLRSVGFGATHISLDKSRMGGDTFQPKNPTFLKPTVSCWAFLFTILIIYSISLNNQLCQFSSHYRCKTGKYCHQDLESHPQHQPHRCFRKIFALTIFHFYHNSICKRQHPFP
jgi:hypothetical protein